jgi:hypothetical protein
VFVQGGSIIKAMEYADNMLDRAEEAVTKALENTTGSLMRGMEQEVDAAERYISTNLVPKLPPNLQAKVDVVRRRYALIKRRLALGQANRLGRQLRCSTDLVEVLTWSADLSVCFLRGVCLCEGGRTF